MWSQSTTHKVLCILLTSFTLLLKFVTCPPLRSLSVTSPYLRSWESCSRWVVLVPTGYQLPSNQPPVQCHHCCPRYHPCTEDNCHHCCHFDTTLALAGPACPYTHTQTHLKTAALDSCHSLRDIAKHDYESYPCWKRKSRPQIWIYLDKFSS